MAAIVSSDPFAVLPSDLLDTYIFSELYENGNKIWVLWLARLRMLSKATKIAVDAFCQQFTGIISINYIRKTGKYGYGPRTSLCACWLVQRIKRLLPNAQFSVVYSTNCQHYDQSITEMYINISMQQYRENSDSDCEVWQVKRLTIHKCNMRSLDEFIHVTDLTLIDCPYITDLSKLTSLRSLRLWRKHCTIYNRNKPIKLPYQNLVELDILNLYSTPIDLSKLSKLKILTIKGFTVETSLPCLPELESLTFVDTEITDLSHIPNLKRLILRDQVGLMELASLVNLTHLRIRDCKHIVSLPPQRLKKTDVRGLDELMAQRRISSLGALLI